MKTLKLILFIIQSIFLGLIVAAAYMLWQADFDPKKIADLMPRAQDKVQTASPHIQTHGPVSYADAVKSSSPSVVTIYTSKKIKPKLPPLLEDPIFDQLFGEQIKKLKREKTETNLGSGVIMTRSGYILTNQHVINGADEILVSLADGRSSEAELIGQDRESDIAVLHIPLNALQNIQIANDKDKVQVGDIALAIGNPLNV
ncbi:MAG: trypsin-like peptidase domain-containing protein, partial [Gammaproteobacteria bacterium]|nr:trypsin-like peptidase domain-containing protein [Gammaproteobacteria bacterium]